MKTGNILFGLLAGVAAGAALGVLLSPDKGSETRKLIIKKGNTTISELELKIDKLLRNLEKSTQEQAAKAVDISMNKAGDRKEPVKK